VNRFTQTASAAAIVSTWIAPVVLGVAAMSCFSSAELGFLWRLVVLEIELVPAVIIHLLAHDGN
jgi:hypothetical protein